MMIMNEEGSMQTTGEEESLSSSMMDKGGGGGWWSWLRHPWLEVRREALRGLLMMLGKQQGQVGR